MQGYYRHPTVQRDRIVFVSEDDLWSVGLQGGVPLRLTSNLGEIEFPLLSPNGSRIAFVARDEGAPDIYVMDATGGPARRLTWQGDAMQTAAWSPDGEWIYFVTSARQPVRGSTVLNRVRSSPSRFVVEEVPLGRASAIGFGPNGAMVLGRNTGDPARWKRYRGGTAGRLWVSPKEGEQFNRILPDLDGNLASPMWIGAGQGLADERIFLVSDHEGCGNIYSCLPSGEDLTRHTDHADFYARYPAWGLDGDGRPIIAYHAGADLHLLDILNDTAVQIDVTWSSPRVQRNRKFAETSGHLESADLHPEGHSVALSARGKAFAFGNHAGGVLQLGTSQGVRYRLPSWLRDGKRIVTVTDAMGEERLQVFTPGREPAKSDLHEGFAFGRAMNLYVNPAVDMVAITNHRYELWLYNLEDRTHLLVDRSPHGHIEHADWSPDGRWLAWDRAPTLHSHAIRLYRREVSVPDGKEPDGSEPPLTVDLGTPVLQDHCPVFDPKGRYLYFLSSRILNPVYDTVQFNLSFPAPMRPYLVTLQQDVANPFVPRTGEDADEEDEEEKQKQTKPDEDGTSAANGDSTAETTDGSDNAKPTKAEDSVPEPVRIDVDGIADRVLPFPMPAGLFIGLAAAEDRVFWLASETRQTMKDPWLDDETPHGAALQAWVFKDHKPSEVAADVSDFSLSANRKHLLYRADQRLRVIKASENADSLTNEGAPRVTGWLDLGRIHLSIEPPAEWQQMLAEAWRLQRDQFWTPGMSGVDWQGVHDRYAPLVQRLASRREFSDLCWEMQGELGTSHCYEFGGDYRPGPDWPIGTLAAEFEWQADPPGWRLDNWIEGDVWEPEVHSPFAEAGVDVAKGDLLVSVNGQPVSESVPPARLLVNLAGQEVQLGFRSGTQVESADNESSAETDMLKEVTVRTMTGDKRALYRAWVNTNRANVHAASDGRLGYLHIPDMGPWGYAEFHRGFLGELHRQGLVVDLRFNGGGHVSALLLEKLARRQIGFDQTRWGGVAPYPEESVSGPIVALTNDAAGSDGDIFSHAFKLMGLGTLIGTRTWGGVIGIWPRHALVDGTVTTQPEYSFWFKDVGWTVENYGTDPDIEVEISPDDFREKRDSQLDTAVAEALRLLQEQPPLQFEPGDLPNLAGAPQLIPGTAAEENDR